MTGPLNPTYRTTSKPHETESAELEQLSSRGTISMCDFSQLGMVRFDLKRTKAGLWLQRSVPHM